MGHDIGREHVSASGQYEPRGAAAATGALLTWLAILASCSADAPVQELAAGGAPGGPELEPSRSTGSSEAKRPSSEPQAEGHRRGDSSQRGDAVIWLEQQRLLPTDAEAQDRFGCSVSIAGDTAVVGAVGDNDDGFESGTAYVFVRSVGSWTLQQKLLPADGQASAQFGDSVSIFGDTALIGATNRADNGVDSGAAYVFVRSAGNWSEQQKLLPADNAVQDHFGDSVSISGDTALVGAPWHDQIGSNSGAAYVYVRSGANWSLQQKLTPADGGALAQFGTSVSVSGDTAVVGALNDDDKGMGAGSAYVYVRSADVWTLQQKLLASDGATFDYFGSSVSISGDTALVGALGDDDNGGLSGSAYAFVRSAGSWTQQQKLLPSDGDDGDGFNVVSVSGDIALVGAMWDSDNGPESGSAYVFVRSANSWTEQQKYVPTDGYTSDQFGRSLSLSGDTALVGAWQADDNGPESGSAYVIALYGDPCVQDDECSGHLCVDGVCCNEPCGNGLVGDCLGCAEALTGPGGQNGLCGHVPNGEPCDDGTFCNGAERCAAGVCVESAGDPCSENVNDGDADCAESCDEDADACTAHDPNGTECAERGSCVEGVCLAPPGEVCTAGEQCVTGYCVEQVCCQSDHCGAYRCGSDGTCLERCSSNADCATGHECTAQGNCEPLAATAGEDSGCGCAIVGRRHPGNIGWLAALAVVTPLLALRRRRSR